MYTHAKRSHTHFKDPVVHVRVRWIMKTLTRPACTACWVARTCCSWLYPGKAIRISHGRNPNGTRATVVKRRRRRRRRRKFVHTLASKTLCCKSNWEQDLRKLMMKLTWLGGSTTCVLDSVKYHCCSSLTVPS